MFRLNLRQKPDLFTLRYRSSKHGLQKLIPRGAEFFCFEKRYCQPAQSGGFCVIGESRLGGNKYSRTGNPLTRRSREHWSKNFRDCVLYRGQDSRKIFIIVMLKNTVFS